MKKDWPDLYEVVHGSRGVEHGIYINDGGDI